MRGFKAQERHENGKSKDIGAWKFMEYIESCKINAAKAQLCSVCVSSSTPRYICTDMYTRGTVGVVWAGDAGKVDGRSWAQAFTKRDTVWNTAA